MAVMFKPPEEEDTTLEATLDLEATPEETLDQEVSRSKREDTDQDLTPEPDTVQDLTPEVVSDQEAETSKSEIGIGMVMSRSEEPDTERSKFK
jgi:hypothetical protein